MIEFKKEDLLPFQQNLQRFIERQKTRTTEDLIKQILTGEYESNMIDAHLFTPNVIRLLTEFYYINTMLLCYFLSTEYKDIDVDVVREFKDFINDDILWKFLNFNITPEVEQMKQENPKFWNEFLKKKYEAKQ